MTDATALAARLDELGLKATKGPWALSYTEVHGKRYGLNGIVQEGADAMLQISGSGGAKSFTRYVIEPDVMHDNIESECALIVELRNNLPAIISALRAVGRARAEALEEAAKACDRIAINAERRAAVHENEPAKTAALDKMEAAQLCAVAVRALASLNALEEQK